MADLIESVAVSLLSQLIAIPVIRANQSGPRPKLPYATYQISARTTIGGDDYGLVDGSGMMPVKGVREGTILVNFYGDEARENADNLVNAIRKTTSRYLMRRLHLVINATGSVTDLTALRDDANFEPMANIDLNFRYTTNYTDDVGLIETVDVTGQVGGEGIHETITIE
ncbi:TPA: hypothetical protein ACM7AW_000031 [Escherichia coli]|nr:hypothetical protein [Escherichia coli]ELC6182539.1 hypothetical protein [Escherichia coli]HAN4255629.1 hypothetical protein [Escherichia coli]